MPLFSIIIPSYNQAKFLEETVRSVISQSFTDWELFIVDDESNDGSLSLAYRLADEHPNIMVLEKKNGGLSSSRNHGIRRSKGRYLHWIDADDRMLPDLLAEAAKAISLDCPDIIQFGYRYLLNADGRILHRVYPRNRFTFPEIFQGSPGSSHSFIVHRSIISKAGFFDETLKSVEDWDFWIRVAKCAPKVSLIPLPLVDYRQHELSMSRNHLVMYEAFKRVAFSAIKVDPRIPQETILNKMYSYDILPVVKQSLLRFTALAILQRKIVVAVSFFQSESETYQWKWEASEFAEMNCYLTFRYRYSKEDLCWIFEDVVPVFYTFFQKLGYKEMLIQNCLRAIFRYHLQNQNIYRFGLFGKLLNLVKIYPGLRKITNA